MYVQLYPRVDSMHLVLAVPSALVLGAGAAARVARAWERALGVAAGWLTTAVAAAAGALAVAAALPNAAALLGAQTVLASAALPVHAETRHAADLRALGALLDYLGPRLAPGAPLFGFPAVALVPFALDRPTPTAHDYFFPGRPDHRAEAEVVRMLEAVRPPYLVTLNRRLGFFSESPMYYFLLRAYVRSHYVLEARFGRYDVLRRGGRGGAVVEDDLEPTVADDPEAVFAALADPDRDIRRAALRVFLAHAHTAARVTALAAAWAPDEARQLLLVRNLGEAGDERAVDYLVGTVDTAGTRLRAEAAGALTYLALRRTSDRYLFTDVPQLPPRALVPERAVPLERLRSWMADYRQRRVIGIYAPRALVDAGDESVVPGGEQVLLADRHGPYHQVPAAEAPVGLGRLE